ncbi:MAG: PqqD family protein [Bacteroidales bacterium]|nr:PqqD family protein [Bacteroidales bacterium]
MIAFSYLADYIPVRKELKFRVEGNVGIICNNQDFRVDYLNETALLIFQLIDGKKSVADIAQCLMKELNVNLEILKRDLVEILRNLQWRKIIILKKKQ